MKYNGIILYQGPSRLDGQPIVAIATGLARPSANAKTGRMVQTWILRQDQEPHTAAHTGADASVCGDCPHRGRIVDRRNVERSCYVRLGDAPLSIYRAWKRGRYPLAQSHADIASALAGKRVRLGAYGDPAAVPVEVWQAAVSQAAGWTGYTHQWHVPEFAPLHSLCMASADGRAMRAAAKLRGFRTFRLETNANARPLPGEIVCPASDEGGHVTSCARCGLCSGTSSKARVDPVIHVHGTGKRHAIALAA